MLEVTAENFSRVYPEIEESFHAAKLISIDTEFSALNPLGISNNSLFDSALERYSKLRKTVEQIIPLQIGITAFLFDPDKNWYKAKTFVFYVFPKYFGESDRTFMCQSSSLMFLCTHHFDFNKFIYSGISYLKEEEEAKLRDDLKYDRFTSLHVENENLVGTAIDNVRKWISTAKVGETLVLSDAYARYKHSAMTLYILHKSLRARFSGKVWTSIENCEFIVKRISEAELNEFLKENLEEIVVDELLGFTKVFNLLKSLKKPIIGHNILTDLMIMVNTFEKPLPNDYMQFKIFLNNLFPIIFDTKTISFELYYSLPQTKRWSQNYLESLYCYFRDGNGRHLVFNSPYIDIEGHNEETIGKFHNAGWDSYCTGYIFIRMAHIYATRQYGIAKNKIYMSSELINAVSKFKNCLNLIRSSISYIKLDGNDPYTTRPPYLIIESVQKRPIDLNHVTSILSNYGFVEVKPLSKTRQSAIIAVDNVGSFRRILQQFKSHSDFHVKPYKAWQHSPIVRTAVWSGAAASGILFLWLLHSTFKNRVNC